MTDPTYSERMAAEAANPSPENAFATGLFEGLPRRYDLLAELLSFGQNARWRHELVDHIAAGDPKRILDVATGTAGVAIELARRTGADVVGVDISEPMLRRGRERVTAAGLDGRITLETGRAEAMRFESGSFDAVSFTYVLRYVPDPEATMRELARVLRPGGVMASLDFFVPPSPVWLAAWRLYTRAVLPAAGWIAGGGSWSRVGHFLGPNIEAHYARRPLARIAGAWEAAGMVGVESRVMSLGGGLVMWGVKR
ncbi:MAG TPA: class I SAM-dependent methyltransferase [Candidatus Dormibacteraeota bacterium]|nr:class I SAM-dependent methyltransferase [Candidatus Dormibacteraeota bacterium]